MALTSILGTNLDLLDTADLLSLWDSHRGGTVIERQLATYAYYRALSKMFERKGQWDKWVSLCLKCDRIYDSLPSEYQWESKRDSLTLRIS
jgi:hypothetical protein